MTVNLLKFTSKCVSDCSSSIYTFQKLNVLHIYVYTEFRIKYIRSQVKYFTELVYTPLSPSDSAALQTCGRCSNSLNRFPTKAI